MNLLIKRVSKKDSHTIGKLYIDSQYFCDTLEDKDRGLYSYMNPGEISRIKIKNETAIPYGKYKVRISFSNRFKKDLPEILNVPGYTGVRIHSGNTAKDSSGCILLGENNAPGKVLNSRVTMEQFMEKIKGENDINLTIE